MKELGYEEESEPFFIESQKLQKKLIKKYSDNILSNKQIEEFCDLKTILKKRDQLGRLFNKNTSNNLLNLQYLLLSLYTYQPPVRNNYSDVEIISDTSNVEPTKNYLLKQDNKYTFLLNNDKVSNKYGSTKLKFTKKLSDIINKSIKHFNRKYLFVNSNGQPLSKQNIASMLENIFPDIKLSITNLRIAYVCDFYSKNKSVNQKKNLSQKMRHSHLTAEIYYNKVLKHKLKSIKRLQANKKPKNKLIFPRNK